MDATSISLYFTQIIELKIGLRKGALLLTALPNQDQLGVFLGVRITANSKYPQKTENRRRLHDLVVHFPGKLTQLPLRKKAIESSRTNSEEAQA